jgi:glycerol dehydrogenase-like iron-containing ADH family enzyme
LISAAAHGRNYDEIRSAFSRAGLPVDAEGLSAFSLRADQVVEAIGAAHRIKPDRYTILEEVGAERLVGLFNEIYRVS